MNEIGIFYGSTTGNTQYIAGLIQKELGEDAANLHDVASAAAKDLEQYDALIFGVPTWGEGDMQDHWATFVSKLKNVNLKGKKIALFGLGDQANYPDTFVDAMGSLFEVVRETGAVVVGSWPVAAYEFNESEAVVNDEFVGLVIDEDNESEMTADRITKWAAQIRPALS